MRGERARMGTVHQFSVLTMQPRSPLQTSEQPATSEVMPARAVVDLQGQGAQAEVEDNDRRKKQRKEKYFNHNC